MVTVTTQHFFIFFLFHSYLIPPCACNHGLYSFFMNLIFLLFPSLRVLVPLHQQ